MKRNCYIYTLLFLFLIPVISFAATAGDVVINEVSWMGTDHSSSDEWVELYNNTDSDIDMSGWTMEDDAGPIDMSFSGVIIPSRGYIIIENSEDTVDDVTGGLIDSSIGFSNTGEKLVLKDNFGSVIDTVGVTATAWYAGTSSPNFTMERKNPMKSGTDATNWATNDGITINGLDADGTPINGTPNSVNSVAEGDTAVYVLIDIALDRMEVTAGVPNSTLVEVKLVDENYFIDKTENLVIDISTSDGTLTVDPVNCISGSGTSILQNVATSGTVTVSATLPPGYTAVINGEIWVDDIDSDGPVAKSITPDAYLQKTLANFATLEAVVDETGGMVDGAAITLNFEVRDSADVFKGGGSVNMDYESGATGGGNGEPVYGENLVYKAVGVDFTNGGTIIMVEGDRVWVYLTGTDYKGQPFNTTNNSAGTPLAKIEIIETKLIITEVNAIADAGGGGLEEDWVEIYCLNDGNNGNGISLEGYYIDDLDSITPNASNPNFADISSLDSNADKKLGNITIKTGEYLLLNYDADTVDETSSTNGVIKVYTADTGLTDSDEQIAIFSPEGKPLDIVAWADYSGSLSDTDLNDSYISGTGQWNLAYGSPASADEDDCVDSEFSKGTIVRSVNNTDTNDKVDWFHTEYATPGGPHPPDTLPAGAVLVINEVMFNPGTDLSDWVEVYCKDDGNNGNGVNIGGCYFQDDGIIKTIKDRTRIKTGEYLILFEGRAALDQHYAGADGVISVYIPDVGLSSTDEGVILKDFSGNIEDVVIYAQNDPDSYKLPVDENGIILPGATVIPNTAIYNIEDLIDVSYIEYNDNVEIMAEVDTDKGISQWVGQNIKFFPNPVKYPDWPGGTEQPDYSYIYDWVYTIDGAIDSSEVKDGYSISRDEKSTDTNSADDWLINENPTIGRDNNDSENPNITISDIVIEPNPFLNDGSDPTRVYSTIAFSLNTQAVVTVRIYDIRGKVVRTLINKTDVGMGDFNIKWFGNDNKNRPAQIGVYIVYIEAINDVSTAVKKKTVVVGKKL